MTTTMTMTATNKIQIPDRLYFRIGDVAELIGVKPYVLRYWESEFPMISPQKSPSGQRVYRRSDVETVVMIKHLLYEERYSIEGARKRIKELRRGGELKEFKEEALTGASVSPVSPLEEAPEETPEGATVAPSSAAEASEDDRAELRTLAYELSELARTPISELFLF